VGTRAAGECFHSFFEFSQTSTRQRFFGTPILIFHFPVNSAKIFFFVSHNKAKKVKNCKIKRSKPNVFGCLPSSDDDDGKQPKTFGFDLLILQFLTF